MICKTCGLELNEGAKFCPGCGQPVELEEQTAAEEVTEATEAVEEPAEESAVPAAEEQPKKKKWLLPVIAGILVLITVVTIFALGGKKNRVVGVYDLLGITISEDFSDSRLAGQTIRPDESLPGEQRLEIKKNGECSFTLLNEKFVGTWSDMEVDETDTLRVINVVLDIQNFGKVRFACIDEGERTGEAIMIGSNGNAFLFKKQNN